MLQRAASNAYSWWWASHIRTKQSKWLDQNLQDMEEKVQNVLKLINEDGDSFAKRAEMYYKKRPELINFVEESYKAYRALADRYDHISTDLQNANNTIAYVFPEQVQFEMEEEEDEPSPKFPKKPQNGPKANIPKVPKIPKNLKGFITTATKKLQTKKPTKAAAATTLAKSGLNKSEGLHEIDRLQKQILALQTEKEFVKNSYENGLAKYWEIDQEIRELQDKVCGLQDEFGAGIVIEDEEARSLMASVALKSCQDTLAQLCKKQEKSAEEAMVERRRIEDTREKFKSLKDKILQGQLNDEMPQAKDEPMKAAEDVKSLDQELSDGAHKRQHLEVLREKIKEHFEVGSTLTVTELAEKIDELAHKVISLEAAVSSQTALIQRLRSETDELQAQIRSLEDDKSTLMDGKKDLNDKLRKMEDRLYELQNLDRTMEVQNSNLQTHFTEARANLDNLSKKLHNVKPDEEVQINSLTEMGCLTITESQEELTGQQVTSEPNHGLGNLPDVKPEEGIKVLSGPDAELKKKVDKVISVLDTLGMVDKVSAEIGMVVEVKNQSGNDEPDCSNSQKSHMDNVSKPNTGYAYDDSPEKFHGLKIEGKDEVEASSGTMNNSSLEETKKQETGQEDEPDWKQLFMNGMENREKVLLTEYTSILRNFKEAKKKLTEQENKGGKSLFDVTVQLKELMSANAKKDEQIQILRQKLNLLQAGSGEEKESEKSTVTGSPITNKDVELNLKELLIGQPSEIEEKFRANIDEVLEGNLDFWMRFSSTFQQIQKFEAEVKDLQSESAKLEEKLKKQDASNAPKYSLKSDAKPLYKHLGEIHTELTVWIEKSSLLKDELKSRFSYLCDIQEEITAALKESAEDEEFRFPSFQAAKFQGEISNMKQENSKVADELQAGLDHVTTLQLQVERSLAKLNEIFKLSGSKDCPDIQLQHSESRSRVPLRSFIFGVKPKRQRPSFFSCMHPGFYRKYHGLRSTPNKLD